MTPEQLYSLLQDLGVKNLKPAPNGELRGCCPVHHDQNPSWSANPYKMGIPCNCFACTGGKGPLQKIVASVLEIGWVEARRYIERFGSYEELPVSAPSVHVNKTFNPTVYRFYENQGASPRLLARGIPQSVQAEARIGRSGDQILIPWVDEGEIVGIEERRETSAIPNYKGMFFPFDRGQYLYDPFQDKSKTIILTEGFGDVLRSGSLGVRNVVGCGTAWISETQVKKIKRRGPETIILGFDNDDAGYRACQKGWKEFKDFCVVLLMPFPRDVHDLGDFPNAACLHEALERADLAGNHLA